MLPIKIDYTTTAGFYETGAVHNLSRPSTSAMKPAEE
jgi:hypothetical protein